MRLAILLVCLSTILGCGQATDTDSLLADIRVEMQNTNAQISDIQVLDTKPRLSQYWVVARGIVATDNYKGSLEDELFGIFVVDQSFTRVVDTIDVFPTPRWRDYNLWIASHSSDRITVEGRGATYQDNATQKSYHVPR